METAMQRAAVTPETVDALHTVYDRAMALYDELHDPDAAARARQPEPVDVAEEPPRAPVIDLASARELTHGARSEPRPELPDTATDEAGNVCAGRAPAGGGQRDAAGRRAIDVPVDLHPRARGRARQAGRPGRRGRDRPLEARERGRHDQERARRPDREHPAPAVTAARSGDPGRRTAAGARRPALARIGGLRSARVRPLHAPAGTDADARGVGRGRGDGPEQHAQGPAVGRRRPHGAVPPDTRTAAAADARAAGAVLQRLRAALPGRAAGVEGTRQAGQPRRAWSEYRARPRRAGKDGRPVRAPDPQCDRARARDAGPASGRRETRDRRARRRRQAGRQRNRHRRQRRRRRAEPASAFGSAPSSAT